MELRQIRYFLSLAEEGNFHRAAATLHVSQPALTRQIQQLEDEIGATLFERTSRGVHLTHAGLAFRGRVQHVVDELEGARVDVLRVMHGEIGEIRIGVNDVALNSPALGRIFADYQTLKPGVELRVVTQNSIKQIASIERQLIDVGFVVLDMLDPPGGIDLIEIERHTMAIALCRTHPLARQRRLDLTDVSKERFVFAQRNLLGSRIYRECLTSGFTPQVVHDASGYALLKLVGLGLGVAFVHSGWLGLNLSDVVVRPIKGMEAVWPLYLARRKDDRSAVVNSFVDCTQRVLNSL